MYRSFVDAVDKLSDRFFVLMTDEVELEHQGISVPAEHTTETPPHHPHKAQKIHHDRECELECPGVDQEQYIITKDSSGSLVSDYQFYEPEVPGVGTRTGFVYQHNKTHGFDYVTLAPLKAGLNSSGRKSSNSGVQTDPQQEKQELITFNKHRAPEKSQQTSELFLANAVADNMTYIQGRQFTQNNGIERETETVKLLGPSIQNSSPTYKNAPARGFLVPYPHDRRQRNLAGQEINFLSMRAMHDCDSGLEWEEENMTEVRPSRQQLYAESTPIRERVVITYVRDAAVSCYSEQDYIGNNVFVILSDSVSGNSKFGDYVVGTVPTMQPEKFYSDRLDDETKVALLQAQQDHDNRLSTENKDVAVWWNNQEPRSVSAFLSARGKDDKEAVPDDYTESVTNLSDYYETEDEVK